MERLDRPMRPRPPGQVRTEIVVAGILGAFLYALTGCTGQDSSGSSVQDEEDRIVFTIQMESIEESDARVTETEAVSDSMPAPPPERRETQMASRKSPAPSPAPSKQNQESGLPASSRPEPVAPLSETAVPRHEVPSNQEASLLPVATPEFPEGAFKPKSDEEKIRAVIRQQEVGMETGDKELIYASLVSVTADTKKGIENFFEDYTDVDVEYSVEDIKITGGNKAEVLVIQKTHAVKKRGKKELESNTKVLWTLLKQGGGWKIRDTKIIKEE
jgi:hypothetical protein